MAATYEAIATVEVGSGGAASIEFTSIAADWTDLTILCSIRSTRVYQVDSLGIKFNSNSSNYSVRNLQGNGSSASSNSGLGVTDRIFILDALNAANSTTSTFSSISIYIPNYASANYKSVSIDSVSENNSTTAGDANAVLCAGLWSNSSAITSIALTSYNGNVAQYSTATLYGIKNS